MSRSNDPRVVEVLSAFDRVVALVEANKEAINAPEIPAVVALEAMFDTDYEDAKCIEHWPTGKIRVLLVAFLDACPEEDIEFAVEQVREREKWVALHTACWVCEHASGKMCPHEDGNHAERAA